MEKRTLETLKYIEENSGCKAKDIQIHLNLSRPLITSILRSLNELELIEVGFGEGRSVSLIITSKGREVIHEV